MNWDQPHLPNAHALIVGIANYPHVNPLPATVLNDVAGIQRVLADPGLCAYPAGNVTLLPEEQATQAGLRQALADLASRTSADSTVFIYLSSHGARIRSGAGAGEYLLPFDVRLHAEQEMAQMAISGAEFSQALTAIPARKLIVVLDCCHAGGVGQPKDAAVVPTIGLSERYLETLQRGRGRVILASSRSTELSWILAKARHSLFTTHLLAGLEGGANGAGGVIRIFDLFDYIQPRVTAERSDQHPIFKAEIEENFPVALYRGGQKQAIPAPVSSPDQYDYDLFISYSGNREDRHWVRSQLLPHLEAYHLRVAVDFRAPLGLPVIRYSEQAIASSRYTVPVLTEAYLHSGFGEFENLAAQHLGYEQSEYRLIPIMAQPCSPRLGLRMLPILDMSNPEEFEYNLERLVGQLQQPPERRVTV
jgi:hypothetical protein